MLSFRFVVELGGGGKKRGFYSFLNVFLSDFSLSELRFFAYFSRCFSGLLLL